MGKGLAFQYYKALSKDPEMGLLNMPIWGLVTFHTGDAGKTSFQFVFISTL